MLRSIWRLFMFLAGLFGLVASGFLILRSRTGERWWPIAFLNSFAHLLMLPSVIVLPISLLTRRRWLALTQLIPLYNFIEAYGHSFDPRRLPAISRQPSAISFELSKGNQTFHFAPRTSYLVPNTQHSALTVMTFNVHKESRHLDPIIKVIRQAGADVVAFQELSQEAVACFNTAFATEYPYRALHAFPQRWCGQGILSRYPIVSDEYWRNAHVPGSMGHQRVELDINGSRVTVYNTHPVHPGMDGGRIWFDTAPRHEELRVIVERAERDTGPVVIVGDFNMPDQAEEYGYIASRFVDSYREVGWGMGFTFPDFRYPQAADEFHLPPLSTPPFIRLDYVFHNATARAIEARVWPDSGGSDHRPVVIKLALPRRPVE